MCGDTRQIEGPTGARGDRWGMKSRVQALLCLLAFAFQLALSGQGEGIKLEIFLTAH